jgi:hypothetical protein
VRKYPHANSYCIGNGSYGDVFAGIMDAGPAQIKVMLLPILIIIRADKIQVVIKILRGVHTDPEALALYKRVSRGAVLHCAK